MLGCLALCTALVTRTSFSDVTTPLAEGSPQPFDFEASLLIKIEEGALQKNGISVLEFNKATDTLFEASSFDLDELRNLKLPTRDGGNVRLQEIAKLEVKLRRRIEDDAKASPNASEQPLPQAK